MEDSDEFESSGDEEDVVIVYFLCWDVELEDERQFFVLEICLVQFLQRCDSCGGDCDFYVQFIRGIMVGIVLVCFNEYLK